MTTLVTGVTGQVGSRFAGRMLARHEPVRYNEAAVNSPS